jgi:hypothetical protein
MCKHCEKNEDLRDVKGFDKIYKELGEKPYEDLTGRKASRLTAIRPVGREKTYGRVLWLCECECSARVIIEATAFKRNKIKSCGCMQKERGKNLRDLTNQVFGKLTVISRAEEDYVGSDGRHRPMWVCSCECGGTITLRSTHLVRGTVTCCDECNPKKRRIGLKLNLVGKRFGKWVVLAEVPQKRTRSGHTRWLCRCDCGTVREVDGGHLTQHASTSCGCSKSENSTAVDITNQVFGRWTALKPVGKDKHNNVRWLCRCACGTEKVLTTNALLSKGSQSCGCLKSERARARRENLVGKKFNMLTVLEKAEDHIYPSGARRPRYKCLCDCGRETIVMANALKNGTCKSCGCLLSYGEKRITEILEKNNVKFRKQKAFKGLVSDKGNRLLFDFYIEDGNYLIEYDGQQHFYYNGRGWSTKEQLAKVQYHDKLKNNYCEKNKVPLIRIPYTHLNNLCLEDLLLETTKFRVV